MGGRKRIIVETCRKQANVWLCFSDMFQDLQGLCPLAHACPANLGFPGSEGCSCLKAKILGSSFPLGVGSSAGGRSCLSWLTDCPPCCQRPESQGDMMHRAGLIGKDTDGERLSRRVTGWRPSPVTTSLRVTAEKRKGLSLTSVNLVRNRWQTVFSPPPGQKEQSPTCHLEGIIVTPCFPNSD